MFWQPGLWQFQVEKGQVSPLPINKSVSLYSLDVVLHCLKTEVRCYLYPSEPFFSTLGSAWTQSCWHKGGAGRTALLALTYPRVLLWRTLLPRICSCRKADRHGLYLLMAAEGFCNPSSLAAGTVMWRTVAGRFVFQDRIVKLKYKLFVIQSVIIVTTKS